MLDMAAKKKPAEEPKRPQRSGKAVNVWIPDDLHDALKTFLASQRVPPRITDVVELALQEFLQREGVWSGASERDIS